jgi:hypothetical protein
MDSVYTTGTLFVSGSTVSVEMPTGHGYVGGSLTVTAGLLGTISATLGAMTSAPGAGAHGGDDYTATLTADMPAGANGLGYGMWNITTPGTNDGTQFTVAAAFTNSPAAADTVTMLQGFKRVPNGVDIEADEGASEGYDRVFHLLADAGKRAEWSGSGAWLFETQLKLRVRFVKFGRLHDWTNAAITNMAILRAGLARTIHYETTYMRALIPDGSIDITHEDNNKLVAEDTFRLFYRLDTSFA